MITKTSLRDKVSKSVLEKAGPSHRKWNGRITNWEGKRKKLGSSKKCSLNEKNAEIYTVQQNPIKTHAIPN